MALILVVDDERSMRDFLSLMLGEAGHEVATASDLPSALAALEQRAFDLVLSDLRLGGGTGLDVLRAARARWPETQVIMMTAFASAENAVESMKLGAYDYQSKPFKLDELRLVIDNALEKGRLLADNRRLRQQVTHQQAVKRIVGVSPSMQATLTIVRKVAPTRAAVLLVGESGTGKEMIARALHELSPRAALPFVALNCGAVPEALMESELFGHVRGAFTGADRDRPGVFEAASGGTLLLDEVAELPPTMQVKLLRALQEQAIRRVGDATERKVDVRVVAATNQDVASRVAAGQLREDLYYRLNVVRIDLPPLRERREDIPLLAKAFVLKHGAEREPPLAIAPDAMAALQRHDYPGNVRELENVIERGLALAEGGLLRLTDLPEPIARLAAAPRPGDCAGQGISLGPDGIALEELLATIERDLLQQALARAGGVKTRAASLLGLSFRSLRYRLAKLGLTGTGDEP